EVIAVNQNSANNRELFQRDRFCGWTADAPGSQDKYLALFNTRDPSATETESAIPVKLPELGFGGEVRVRDLWRNEDLGWVANEFAPIIHAHGAGLYRVSPGK